MKYFEKSRLIATLTVTGCLAFAGCSTHRTMVVLVPDHHGQVGSVEVVTEGGSSVLTEPGQTVLIKDRNLAPREIPAMDDKQIAVVFADAMAAEPPEPEKFILYFKTDTTQLTNDSYKVIPAVLNAVHNRQSQDISINGHTDRAGSKAHNHELSLKRAIKMKKIMIKAGIDPNYLSTTSHGEGNPLVQTPDGVFEPRNRRVEIIVR